VKVQSVQFDEEGGIVVQYIHEHEQTAEGNLQHVIYINPHGLQTYDRVAYYATELLEDVEEMVAWYEKYKAGTA
jgi:hypothetical protein